MPVWIRSLSGSPDLRSSPYSVIACLLIESGKNPVATESDTSGNAGADFESMRLLRVYIKKQSDFKSVKEICSRVYPGVPAVYIEADICRDNLLVEIEAESSNNSLTITK